MSRLAHGPSGLFFAALLLSLTGCGGRAVNKKLARDLILELPGHGLERDDVTIVSVTQAGARDAVVETRLKTAFKFEKSGGVWRVREARLGNGAWVSVEDLAKAVSRLKLDETRAIIENVLDAVGRYRLKNGRLPEFTDYVTLSDVLVPDYLSTLVRVDSWQHPLAAYRAGANTVRVVSAGPDGRPGTSDDVEMSRSFPQ